jgi:uncharacterized protein (DUF2336 family)
MELAQDINIVTIPILELSNALTDENLIYIIKKSNDEEKEKSISKRETVSENVSNALIENGHEEVVATLLNNKGASVSDDDYNTILEKFNETESILSVLKNRAKLPLNIVKSLKDEFTDNEAVESVNNSNYKQDVEKEYYQFSKIVKQDGIQDNIAPVYALCLGNIKLFEICVARKLKIPILNVRQVLEEGGDESFHEIYKRTGLPENLFSATETLMCVLNNLSDELSFQGLKISEKDSKRVISNLLMYSEEEGGIENVEYLITLIKDAAKKR